MLAAITTGISRLSVLQVPSMSNYPLLGTTSISSTTPESVATRAIATKKSAIFRKFVWMLTNARFLSVEESIITALQRPGKYGV